VTFEEAWPHIKEGKPFRYRFLGNSDWKAGEWQEFKLTSLYEMDSLEFDLGREPREFVLGMTNEGYWQEVKMPPPKGTSLWNSSYLITVREVIE
jgi:hypothetical protein